MTAGAAEAPASRFRQKFEQQATRALIAQATAYARRRSELLGRVTRRHDDLKARELVQDALVDTLDGRVAWDPERVSLLTHVLTLIQSRTRHELARAARMPHRSLDESGDDSASDIRPIEREASLAVRTPETGRGEDVVLRARQFVDALTAALPAKDPAHALLRAYAEGKTERADVLAATGMSAATYKNERRRVVRLAKRLDDQLLATAREVLR